MKVTSASVDFPAALAQAQAGQPLGAGEDLHRGPGQLGRAAGALRESPCARDHP